LATRSPARATGILLCLHFAAFLAFSYFAFLRNPFAMFWSEEGLTIKLMFREQCLWDTVAPFLQMSHRAGIGDQSFGIESRLMPIPSFQCWAGFPDIDPVLTYLAYAAEIFLAVFILGRAFAFSRQNSLGAAWATAILALPYLAPNYLIYPVGHIVPLFVETMAIASVTLAAYAAIGRLERVWGNLALGLVCAGLIAWYATVNPTFTVVMAPFLMVFGLAATIMVAGRRELYWKIGFVILFLAFLFIAEIPQFLLGIAKYSAIGFFPTELESEQDHLLYGSILFQARSYSEVASGFWIVALLGGLVRLAAAEQRQRRIAIAHLCGMGLILTAALILHHPGSSYRSLKVLYVESIFWPIYLLHAAAFFGAIWHYAVRLCNAVGARLRQVGDLSVKPLLAFATIAVGCVFSIAPAAEPDFASEGPTPVTEYLAARIAVTPGEPFRGREATFTGYRDKPPGIGWFDLDLLAQYRATRNEHHLAGLWEFDIPTIQDDSALMSPPLMALASRLLARKGDRQYRDVVLLTRPDARILAAIGVRYVVSDEDAIPGAVERLTWTWAPEHELRVFEIEHANLGQYSPVRVEIVPDATALIERLRQGVDTSEIALLAEPVAENLTPAHDANLVMERGHIRLTAHSDGTSLLVLPFEFSHCLRFESAAPGQVRLLRANLVNTAVLFSGALDGRLSLEIGPFGRGTCRLEDVAELEEFGLRTLPR
jgi:hypothetical protein